MTILEHLFTMVEAFALIRLGSHQLMSSTRPEVGAEKLPGWMISRLLEGALLLAGGVYFYFRMFPGDVGFSGAATILMVCYQVTEVAAGICSTPPDDGRSRWARIGWVVLSTLVLISCLFVYWQTTKA